MKRISLLLLLVILIPGPAFCLTSMAEEEMAEVQGAYGITVNFDNGALGGAIGATMSSLSWTDNDGTWGHAGGTMQMTMTNISTSFEWSPTTIDVTSTGGGSDVWIIIDPPEILNKDFQFRTEFIDPLGVAPTRTAGEFGYENLDWTDTGGYTNDLELFTLDSVDTCLGIWLGGEWVADYLFWHDDGYPGRAGDAYLKTETFAFDNDLTTLYGWLDAGSDGTNSYLRFTWPNSAENNNRDVLFGRIGVVPTAGTALTNSNTLLGLNIYDMILSQNNRFIISGGGNTGEGIGLALDAGFSDGTLVIQDHDGFGSYSGKYIAFRGFHMDTDNTGLVMDIITEGGTKPEYVFYNPGLSINDFGFTSIQMGNNSLTGGGPSLCSIDFDNWNVDTLIIFTGNNPAAADPWGIQLEVEVEIHDWDIHAGDNDGSTVQGPNGSAITNEGHFYVHNIRAWDPNSYQGRVMLRPMVLQAGTSGTSRLQLSIPSSVPMVLEYTTRTANAANVGEDIFMHHIEGSINFSGPVEIYAH